MLTNSKSIFIIYFNKNEDYYNSVTWWLSNLFSQGPLKYKINSADPFRVLNVYNPNIQISWSLLKHA